jgi:hypothetical protein
MSFERHRRCGPGARSWSVPGSTGLPTLGRGSHLTPRMGTCGHSWPVDAIVIAVVVVLNAILGYVQEARARARWRPCRR